MKYILFIIVFVFLFGKITKYALKYWLSSKISEAQRNFNGQQTAKKSTNTAKEGTIKVDFDPRKGNSTNPNQAGDYIDYEVVK